MNQNSGEMNAGTNTGSGTKFWFSFAIYIYINDLVSYQRAFDKFTFFIFQSFQMRQAAYAAGNVNH